MNNVVLIGRLTKEPDLSYTPSGTAVCKFTLAIGRQGSDGTDFIRIIAWNKVAENCNKYLAKGRQVGIQGRIQTGSYKNNDGQTVYTTDVIANNVEFLTKSQGRSDNKPKYEEIDDLPDEYERIDEDIPF
jgi:single-strand DNA-binding protein